MLVLSLGLFLYQIGLLNQQGITGYAVFEMTEKPEIAVVGFTIISIIIAFSALATSINIPTDDRMKQLLSNVSVALNSNETTAARMMYIQLRNSYKKLPKQDKRKYKADCVKLYQKLVNQLMIK